MPSPRFLLGYEYHGRGIPGGNVYLGGGLGIPVGWYTYPPSGNGTWVLLEH